MYVPCITECTVLSLKLRIGDNVPNVPPPCRQQLVCNGLRMEDNEWLVKFKIFEHPIVLNEEFRVHLIVRTPTNNTINIHISSEKNLFNLKCLIRDRTSPPIKVSKQQLYYQGRVLEDTHTISSCNFPSDPLLQLCKSQLLYEPLEEEVGSEGKLINWQQHRVEITVPPVCHAHVTLRVYGASATCFEYPPEYNPVSNIYEISITSREGDLPQRTTIAFSNFKRDADQCVMTASRNPSKWTPNGISPVFSFSRVEGIDTKFATGRVEVTLTTNGAYLFVAMTPKTFLFPPPQSRHLPYYTSPQAPPGPVPVSVYSPYTPPHYQDSSPEYRTMLSCIPQLNTALTQAPKEIFDDLLAAGLMSERERYFMHNDAHDTDKKAAKLVNTMIDRVKATPSEFNTFVAILERKRWTESIAQVLKTALAQNRAHF